MSLEITRPEPKLIVSSNHAELALFQTRQFLDVTLDQNELHVDEHRLQLTIDQPNVPELTVYSESLSLEIIPSALTIIQNYSGEGAVADQDTIVGAGTQASPLSAPDMLRITRRLSEFDTQTARHEARDNLGLNIIDGGHFL